MTHNYNFYIVVIYRLPEQTSEYEIPANPQYDYELYDDDNKWDTLPTMKPGELTIASVIEDLLTGYGDHHDHPIQWQISSGNLYRNLFNRKIE